jgi:hypothetical protein
MKVEDILALVMVVILAVLGLAWDWRHAKKKRDREPPRSN